MENSLLRKLSFMELMLIRLELCIMEEQILLRFKMIPSAQHYLKIMMNKIFKIKIDSKVAKKYAVKFSENFIKGLLDLKPILFLFNN